MKKWNKLYDRFLSRKSVIKAEELTEVMAHFGYQKQDGVPSATRICYRNASRDKNIYIHSASNRAIITSAERENIAKSLAIDRGEEVSMYEVLTYKGCIGSIEVSMEDRCLHGKVLGIRDLVLYEGNTLTELENDFRDAVDIYLADRG